jgi:hypothetical protein
MNIISAARCATRDDARQFSHYGNGRVAPSLEAAACIGETFNITLDYLLLPGAPRPPGGYIDAKRAKLAHFTNNERTTILAVIDAIITKTRLRLITGNAS